MPRRGDPNEILALVSESEVAYGEFASPQVLECRERDRFAVDHESSAQSSTGLHQSLSQTASTSSVMDTLSPTTTPALSIVSFQLTPKS